MKLVEQHIIKQTNSNYKQLEQLAMLSANLYNSALFAIRQHYFNRKGKQFITDICSDVDYDYVNYYELNRIFKSINQIDYRSLPANISQEVLKQVDLTFKSFFKLLNTKQNNKYSKPVKLPHYKKQNSKNIIVLNCSTLSKTNSSFKIPKTKIVIDNIKYLNSATQIRIIPKANYFVLEVIYEAKERDIKSDNNRYLSIDLGVNNLAACSSNVINSFLINGKPIKSINQYYNKTNAKLKSNLELVNKIKSSKKLRQFGLKRSNKLKWYMHNASKFIIDKCLENEINTIIIGKNNGWKQEINIGKQNNQTFVSIPFSLLVEQIKYKGRLQGINVIEQEESYTSKVSFFDNDFIPVYGKTDDKLNPSGKRIKRGLYQTKENHYINADINGSLNILRKYLNVASNSIIGERSRGLVVNPYIVTFK